MNPSSINKLSASGCGRALLAALGLLALVATTAAAQTGRIAGVVKDDSGQPIKGATVTAENPDASPSSFTASTDDKGRFSIIGLRAGSWMIKAQAPGFTPESGMMPVRTIGVTANPQITIMLHKGAGAPTGALAGMSGKDLQSDLAAADQAFNAQRWDEAITRYRTLLAKAPALNVINLQIGAAYRNKREYDAAIAAYNEVLKTDPNNDKAKVGIALANLEKGDIAAAETALTAAVDTANPSRDVLFSLAEVKFAKGQIDEATRWYQKAADVDPGWGRPLYKLALVSLNKGDKDGASKLFERVITVDPVSPEAAEARSALDQLKK